MSAGLVHGVLFFLSKIAGKLFVVSGQLLRRLAIQRSTGLRDPGYNVEP